MAKIKKQPKQSNRPLKKEVNRYLVSYTPTERRKAVAIAPAFMQLTTLLTRSNGFSNQEIATYKSALVEAVLESYTYDNGLSDTVWLCSALVWKQTAQGHKFWSKLYAHISNSPVDTAYDALKYKEELTNHG